MSLPFSAKWIPNALTLSRALLCPLVIFLFLTGRFAPGLLLFVLSCLTDFLDGYLARRLHAVTDLGRLLDPVSDKLLTLSFFSLLLTLKVCPAWFLGLLVAASLLQALGMMLMRWYHPMPFSPLRAGKWNTTLQFVWIGLQLLDYALTRGRGTGSLIPSSIAGATYALLAVLQVYVFFAYFFRFRWLLTRLFPLFHSVKRLA